MEGNREILFELPIYVLRQVTMSHYVSELGKALNQKKLKLEHLDVRDGPMLAGIKTLFRI